MDDLPALHNRNTLVGQSGKLMPRKCDDAVRRRKSPRDERHHSTLVWRAGLAALPLVLAGAACTCASADEIVSATPVLERQGAIALTYRLS